MKGVSNRDICFIYNILLIILYSFTSTFTLNLYLKNKQPIFIASLLMVILFVTM